jgi:short-subunit dehydrogenase
MNMAKTALITGASSGIGYELAKLFAQDGINLVLVARDESRLQKIASELSAVQVKTIRADLSRPETPAAIYEETGRASIAIDYLVNNAGFGVSGPFADTDLDAELDLIQVNVTSVVHLTKLYLRDMLRSGAGGILNVASTAAFQPGPLMSTYYASKAFVLSFTEAIATEVRKTKVTVTALCPGPTATDFQRRARIEGIRLMKSGPFGMMSGSEVARIGYRGFFDGKVIVIPGMLNKIGIQMVRLAPRALVRQITRKLQES